MGCVNVSCQVRYPRMILEYFLTLHFQCINCLLMETHKQPELNYRRRKPSAHIKLVNGETCVPGAEMKCVWMLPTLILYSNSPSDMFLAAYFWYSQLSLTFPSVVYPSCSAVLPLPNPSCSLRPQQPLFSGRPTDCGLLFHVTGTIYSIMSLQLPIVILTVLSQMHIQ